jgi:rsbT co-antagonist protein RsbR
MSFEKNIASWRERPMSKVETSAIVALVGDEEQAILAEWLDLQKRAGALDTGRINASELSAQCREFLKLFRQALAKGGVDVADASYIPVRDFLGEVSRSRAMQGFSPKETATFVFSLKQPLFSAMNRVKAISPVALAQTTWAITLLLDELGLYTAEIYQKSREEVILRQQREITELSTPVVKLWDGVLALPIIGTLDSQRTQVVMENLLQSIVEQGAEIAIIDITGVPTVDTLTAQHLLKTVSAARLMGADCIISGIRPQIAQTIVHLGVELNVVSKATLADAFALALKRTGKTVTKVKSGQAEKEQRPAEKGD